MSISHFATGVSTMPPTESPVDATDSATDRRTWYQRVTTVVTGIRPAAEKPTAKTAYTAYSCQRSCTCPRTASASPPSTPPSTSTTRTSRLAMMRAIHSPTIPPMTKNSVVASEIDASDHPCSLLNALR